MRGPNDFEPAFTAMTQRPDALFVVAEALTLTHVGPGLCGTASAARHVRIRVFAHDGGLMAYGPKLTETFQRGAYYMTESCKAPSPPTCPWSSLCASSWLSTSRPPKLGLTSHQPSWCKQTVLMEVERTDVHASGEEGVPRQAGEVLHG